MMAYTVNIALSCLNSLFSSRCILSHIVIRRVCSSLINSVHQCYTLLHSHRFAGSVRRSSRDESEEWQQGLAVARERRFGKITDAASVVLARRGEKWKQRRRQRKKQTEKEPNVRRKGATDIVRVQNEWELIQKYLLTSLFGSIRFTLQRQRNPILILSFPSFSSV
jgi:hypothetical protein